MLMERMAGNMTECCGARCSRSQEFALAAARRVQNCLGGGGLLWQAAACRVHRERHLLVVLNQEALVLLQEHLKVLRRQLHPQSQAQATSGIYASERSRRAALSQQQT